MGFGMRIKKPRVFSLPNHHFIIISSFPGTLEGRDTPYTVSACEELAGTREDGHFRVRAFSKIASTCGCASGMCVTKEPALNAARHGIKTKIADRPVVLDGRSRYDSSWYQEARREHLARPMEVNRAGSCRRFDPLSLACRGVNYNVTDGERSL